jgi:hypothetical protein
MHKNNQAPRNNNQTIANNQILISKQKLTGRFGDWLLDIVRLHNVIITADPPKF